MTVALCSGPLVRRTDSGAANHAPVRQIDRVKRIAVDCPVFREDQAGTETLPAGKPIRRSGKLPQERDFSVLYRVTRKREI
jgi:hypothetical protein